MEIRAKLEKLRNNEGVMKYLKNTSWLFVEKFLRMTLGVFVSIWIARYLGPNKFGLFNYVLNYALLFSVISTLGLDGIIVRELVNNNYSRDKLLGTACILKLGGACLTLILLCTSSVFQQHDEQANRLILIIGFSTVFQSLNVIDFYFQSKVLSKFVVYSNCISQILLSFIRIILILAGGSILSFTYAVLFESIIFSIGLLYYYSKEGLFIKNWNFDSSLASKLLKSSFPLIISSIVVTIYMKIDIIMLKSFLGDYEVGLYAASSRISELFYLVPVLVSTSLFPAILNAKKTNHALYEKRIEHMYQLLVGLAIIFAIVINLTGSYITLFLYGAKYISASKVLVIQVWSGVFICLLVISNKWLLAENHTTFIFMRGVAGALINIVLNYIYIPRYGINAAAYTSLITLIFSSLVMDLFFSPTRKHLGLKLKAFMPHLYIKKNS